MEVRCIKTCMLPDGGKIIKEGHSLDSSMIPNFEKVKDHFVSLDQEATRQLKDRYQMACSEEKKLAQQLEQIRLAKVAIEKQMAATPEPKSVATEAEARSPVVATMSPDDPESPVEAPPDDDLNSMSKEQLIKLAIADFQETLSPEKRKAELIAAIRGFRAKVTPVKTDQGEYPPLDYRGI